MIDKIIFGFFVLFILLVSFADGSRSLIASSFFVIYVEILLLFYLVVGLRTKQLVTLVSNYKWILIVLVLWLLVSVVKTFGLLVHPSVDQYASVSELSLFAGYVSCFVLALCLVRNRTRYKVVAATLLLVALAHTLFGLVNYYADELVFGWLPTHYASSRVTGFFVNRNFYANFVLMSLGFVLIPLLFYKKNEVMSLHPQVQKLNRNSVLAMFAVLFVIMISGVILSGSRGAIVSMVIAFAMVVLISTFNRLVTIRWWPLAFSLLLSVVLFGYKLLGFRMLSGINDLSARTEQWKATWAVYSQSWFSGYGPGSYEIAYKSGIPFTASPMTHNHAHNDYLELLLEQGLLGFLPLLAFAVIVYFLLIKKASTSKSFNRFAMIVSSLFGMIVIQVHALYDFPFQVPSNVFLFLMLVAMSLNSIRMPLRSLKYDIS